MKFYIVVKKPKIVICDTEKEAIIEYFKDDNFYGENQIAVVSNNSSRDKNKQMNVFEKKNRNRK